MRPSRIKTKLANGEPVLVTHLAMTDGSLIEMASLMGFDGLWIDFEHHGFNMETAHHLFRAARVGSADIVARPAKGEFMRMGRLLEAGANGIMYPRCDNAAEAAEVVKWAKFPPLGKRGVDAGNPDAPYCSVPVARYIREANERTFIMIQLEEQCGVNEADAIAAIPGVDILFLGPNDFTALSGIPGQYDHPLVERAIDQIAAAAARHGKAWGTIARSPEHGRELLARGARFLAHGADIVMLQRALANIQSEFSELGLTFNNQLGSPRDAPPHPVVV